MQNNTDVIADSALVVGATLTISNVAVDIPATFGLSATSAQLTDVQLLLGATGALQFRAIAATISGASSIVGSGNVNFTEPTTNVETGATVVIDLSPDSQFSLFEGSVTLGGENVTLGNVDIVNGLLVLSAETVVNVYDLTVVGFEDTADLGLHTNADVNVLGAFVFAGAALARDDPGSCRHVPARACC